MRSPKKYKRYIIDITHRSYNVQLQCTAKSYKEAAEKCDVSTYFMKGYGMVSEVDEPIDEVMAQIDSGFIVFDPFNRKDLMRKLMPWSELEPIINEYITKYHESRLKDLY